MQQLLAGGVVRRGTLGIETQDVDDRIASSLGLDVARGAAVTRVYAGSAGEKAGLEPGDVIVAANGQRIDDSETLRNFQGLQAPDAKVALDVRRAGKPLQLSATLREQPRALDGNALDPRLSGARFAELPETARRGGISGVLVAEVARGSRAASNGLREGDVVLAASSGGFSDLPGFRASVGKQPARLVLRILRGGRQGTLPMQ
jgi:S1-C subfamily serine protease